MQCQYVILECKATDVYDIGGDGILEETQMRNHG